MNALFRIFYCEFTNEVNRLRLASTLAAAKELPPLSHPRMAETYRERITDLPSALNEPTTRLEAVEILRSLIDVIVLFPEKGELKIELHGDLAGIIQHRCKGKEPVPNGRALVAS